MNEDSLFQWRWVLNFTAKPLHAISAFALSALQAGFVHSQNVYSPAQPMLSNPVLRLAAARVVDWQQIGGDTSQYPKQKHYGGSRSVGNEAMRMETLLEFLTTMPLRARDVIGLWKCSQGWKTISRPQGSGIQHNTAASLEICGVTHQHPFRAERLNPENRDGQRGRAPNPWSSMHRENSVEKSLSKYHPSPPLCLGSGGMMLAWNLLGRCLGIKEGPGRWENCLLLCKSPQQGGKKVISIRWRDPHSKGVAWGPTTAASHMALDNPPHIPEKICFYFSWPQKMGSSS